jgi:hypothetical protein
MAARSARVRYLIHTHGEKTHDALASKTLFILQRPGLSTIFEASIA